jgi:hypothetical protein
MINARIRILFAMAFVAACSSNSNRGGVEGKPRSELLLDSLTSFAQSIQEDRFEKAMQCLSPSERLKFQAAGGTQDPILQRRMKALRLSTLARRPTVKLERGGLVGIFEELPALPSDSPPPTREEPPTSDDVPEDMP